MRIRFRSPQDRLSFCRPDTTGKGTEMYITSGDRLFDSPTDIIQFHERIYPGEAKRYVIAGFREEDVDAVAYAVDASYDFDQELLAYPTVEEFERHVDIDPDSIVMVVDEDGYWHVAVKLEFDDGDVWEPTF